jgi:DNA-binding Lrp family transcriptional regulator
VVGPRPFTKESTKDIVEAIRGVEGVISVDAVTGPYDAIAVIQGKTLNEIGDLVTAKVHPIRGVSRTVTCLVLKGP